jgi:hypothetical protein
MPTEDFQLHFRSLFTDREAFDFPCDAGGHVVMDALSERARSSYLFARATVGRFYAPPQVIAVQQCDWRQLDGFEAAHALTNVHA